MSGLNLSGADIATIFGALVPGLKQIGSELRGPCPVHNGKDANFSVNPETGQAFCHSHCNRGWDTYGLIQELHQTDFLGAKREISKLLGCLDQSKPSRKAMLAPVSGEPHTTYDYTDESGTVLYQVCRYETKPEKTFRQRRPDGRGGWIANLNGVEPLPFRLPAVAVAPFVWVVEGEKDALTLATLGLTATCNSGGAGNFKPELARWFLGKNIAILPDNDKPGREHAAKVAAILAPVAASVRIVDLPDLPAKGDVTDWVNAGGDEEALARLYEAAPPWEAVADGPLSVDSLKSVWDYENVEIKYVVEGVIPDGAITLLCGETASGKSTVATALALAVHRGTEFAGFKCKRRPVLILDRENPIAVVIERLKRLGATSADGLIVWGGWQPEQAPPPDSPVITDWIERQLEKPLIVVDSLIAFHTGSENDAAETREYMNAFRAMAYLGATVVILHHTGKGETTKEYRGSSDLLAAVDVALLLKSDAKTRSTFDSGSITQFKSRIQTKGFDFRIEGTEFKRVGDIDGAGQRYDRLTPLLASNPLCSQKQFLERASAISVSRDVARRYLEDGVRRGSISQTRGTNNSLLHQLVQQG
jgi:hypothetical protein